MQAGNHSGNLRSLLTHAVRDYEISHALFCGKLLTIDTSIGAARPEIQHCIAGELLRGVLFKCTRALRILEHASDKIDIERHLRKEMIRFLTEIRPLRDINEHWLDPKNTIRDIKMYNHLALDVAVDSFSIIVKDGQILIGGQNMNSLYEKLLAAYNKMRELDGISPYKSNI